MCRPRAVHRGAQLRKPFAQVGSTPCGERKIDSACEFVNLSRFNAYFAERIVDERLAHGRAPGRVCCALNAGGRESAVRQG
jgi:hypothetical protein